MDANPWMPLAPEKLAEIGRLFEIMFPRSDFGGLAAQITDYWLHMLNSVWQEKDVRIKSEDVGFAPSDPLSRFRQKTVVIAYPDSVREKDLPTLAVLGRFLSQYFPAAGGLHILPACRVVKDRFNDGYFSQVQRNRIDPAFGTNDLFAGLAGRCCFMADFVLNHVDIAHPKFRAYLDGDDAAGECFYVFSEKAYQQHLDRGDFDRVFRPRPFPLFTLFRRRPRNSTYAGFDPEGRIMAMDDLLPFKLPLPVIRIFSIFSKIKNDQMLLDEDYDIVSGFRRYLRANSISPDAVFTLSSIQETRHPPYIFKPHIRTRTDLLVAVGYEAGKARQFCQAFEKLEGEIFGEYIRALTTFSHVQVDVNTSTLAGLVLLADDFSWYLGLDLNLLRLDAANYAFKKWKTPCFGLPEVRHLMRILYLSMECAAPRISANLEVNDTLSNVLSQLAAPDAPPVMYDFHLAGMLPAVFNLENAEILHRIQEMTARFDIPPDRIRFSVAESHDGKSVRGSLDLLNVSERAQSARVAMQNGGRIKYKSVPARQIGKSEFENLCREAGFNARQAIRRLFGDSAAESETLFLKDEIRTPADIFAATGPPASGAAAQDVIEFLADKMLFGREPYELCVSTRDAMVRLEDRQLEVDRYLAFYTLAFALTGRNIRTIYFNDLMGLGNDLLRMEATGELRDIKRTRSKYADLSGIIEDPSTFHHAVAAGINRLISLADSDPALNFRGHEARTGSAGKTAALVYNHCRKHWSLALVNIVDRQTTTRIVLPEMGIQEMGRVYDNVQNRWIDLAPPGRLDRKLAPFERLWLTENPLAIQ